MRPSLRICAFVYRLSIGNESDTKHFFLFSTGEKGPACLEAGSKFDTLDRDQIFFS
jgi:hypothetical protein